MHIVVIELVLKVSKWELTRGLIETGKCLFWDALSHELKKTTSPLGRPKCRTDSQKLTLDKPNDPLSWLFGRVTV